MSVSLIAVMSRGEPPGIQMFLELFFLQVSTKGSPVWNEQLTHRERSGNLERRREGVMTVSVGAVAEASSNCCRIAARLGGWIQEEFNCETSKSCSSGFI